MTLISDFVAGRTPPQLYETYLSPGLFEPWGDVLLAGLPPSGDCLDIGCGTGVVSRKLAADGNVSRIAAIDVADPMIAHAKQVTAAKGLDTRISFDVASALDLPFASDAFDRAYCQQAIQFFPDRIKAMCEVKRVLKPGGQFAAAVWTAAADGNPVFGAFEEIVGRTFGSDLLPFGPFAFGDETALRSVIEEGGLKIHSLERREMECTLPDVESFVLFDLLFLGRPDTDGVLQPVVAPDDPDGDGPVAQLILEMKSALADYVQPDGTLRAPTTAHMVIAEA
ncbi:class I SAM-dependent methyltransferase [Parasphingopyxis sp. CP4]|uniref:class I SAM-dependent methyltransferase n=1 Tax=Parasphingopyxis sp. CP4 TaxID=2724527 RepID=UPI00159FEADF|nr:class I SAM-dependent methyltransferase [Parasphingopyxis sp. CP4]QLC21190.1 class I SAM-dependent methyltransferase [Parasphingopyxis sp. CP4]